MKLQFDFPIEVRNLFIDCFSCWECGQNGSQTGGLQLHHIWGRVSCSALNGAILCARCHEKVTHSVQEHRRYFLQTYAFLLNLAHSGLFKWGITEDSFVELVWQDIGDLLSTV